MAIPSSIQAGVSSNHNTVRMLHSDMEVPDFSYYRRPSTKDSSAKNQENTDR